MFTRTLVGVVAALLVAPAANAQQMHWYHWHPGAVRQQHFGGRAVVGLRSMSDLPAVRKDYGLRQVRAIPPLKAAEIRFDRGLVTRASHDARIRYISPVGPTRHTLAMAHDPLLTTVDPATALPYEWEFGAAHVDQALQYTHGSSSILVGTIDTGLADVPDLAGKIAGRWDISLDGTLTAVPAEGDDDDAG